MKKAAILPIKFYKRFISSATANRCIYEPSCSMYAAEAIRKFGALRGIIMGAGRILRYTPFHAGGRDPVPENYRGRAKWLI